MIKGRTIQPVSRSSTTLENEPGESPVFLERREIRTTSPPIVVGRAFETNWPASEWESRVSKRLRKPRERMTCIQRRVDNT